MINQITSQSDFMSKVFAKNFVWVANNLTDEPHCLSLEETKGLMTIFCEFLDSFINSNDEDSI